MVTQAEIAKMLNISRTTVARAINGIGSIKPETKEKIIELCNEVGYERNPISTSLALKKERNIFVFIVKTRSKYYTNEIKKGLKKAENELKIYKYKLNIIETHIDEPFDQVKKLKKVLNKKIADGIIITPLLKKEVIDLKRKNSKVAFIALDLPLDKNTISIHSDYYKVGRLVANMLLNSLNYGDKILIIDSNDDRISSKNSFLGVYDKLSESNKCEIIGPIFQENIESNIEQLIDNNFNDDIKAIFSSRFLDKIIDYTNQKGYKGLRIVFNGLSDKIYKYIEDDIVMACIVQNYYHMSYMSAKTMFEYLYRGIEPKEKINEYPCRILLKENLSSIKKY